MTDPIMKGIDVSAYQTNVDYNQVKKAGYNFVIIRDGWGKELGQKDPQFETHYANATKAGLYVGAYHYSYALTDPNCKMSAREQGIAEAKTCYEFIKGHQFSMPIWYDVEEQAALNHSKDELDQLVHAFCETMESYGYYCGIYGGQYLFENKLYSETTKRFALWYAQYLLNPRYKGEYGVWQFGIAGASAGNNPAGVPKIPGINGECDVNYCYFDYPTTIKDLGLNGYGNIEPIPTTPQFDDIPVLKEYKQRLTIPKSGNKYFNTTNNGGYAVGLIDGNPKQKGLNVLSNCFSGETKIITRNGVVRLDSIVDQEVEVLSQGGVYRKAVGKCFGEQELYKITFNNSDSYICTANHRWVVRKSHAEKDDFCFKETLELKNSDYIPYNFIRDEEYDEDAIRHGFIYGDGSVYNTHQSQANLCGKKRDYMKEYFKDAVHTITQKNGTVSCYPYPFEYKSVPDLDKPLPYLRGFIKGLIASDGCVDKYGCTKLATVKEQDARKIKEICSILGYRSYLKSETRDTNYKENSTLWVLSIKKNCLPISMFINPEQIERIENTQQKEILFTGIKEIIPLHITEKVYCVQEPETHTMTLDNGILTGQCVGYSAGRFNEILGLNKWKFFSFAPNAEDWITKAQAEGLEISQTPSLGAVIVWAKGKVGNSDDGAGHVAIVEQVNQDGSIITSESGYGCSNPFWTSKRYNGDGRWGAGGAYTFLGFIKNPAVNANTVIGGQIEDPVTPSNTGNPYKEPTDLIKEGSKGDGVKWVQYELTRKKYFNDEIDGDFQVITLGAVLAFQKKNGLTVDGIVGPATRNALKK